MKRFVLPITLFSIVACSVPDSPTAYRIDPSYEKSAEVVCGAVVLLSQAAVNSFDCTVVTGYLQISGPGITNLNGLSDLASVGEGLAIHNNPSLTDLHGLGNLTSIGGSLDLYENPFLTSLVGFSSLTAIGGHLHIWSNSNLATFEGLSALTSVGSNVAIFANPSLTTLRGLSELNLIGGQMGVHHNEELESLDGLSSLISVGGAVSLEENPKLSSLSALSSLVSIGGDLSLNSNPSLADLAGLDNLLSVGGLDVANNATLSNFDGLSNLKLVDGLLGVLWNPALTNLNGLAGLIFVGGDIYIRGNDQLSECTCGLAPLLMTAGGGGDFFYVGENTSGCNSKAEVLTGVRDYPECACRNLVSFIDLLVLKGVLPQGRSLTGKAEDFLLFLQEDRPASTSMFNAFSREVDAYLRANLLTEEEADRLILGAELVGSLF